MLGECNFCGNGKIVERTIYRSETVFAFPSNTPIVPGHLLICPVRCVATIGTLTADEWTALLDAMEKLKPALSQCFAAEAFNFAWNEGFIAGQTVPHLHIHMLPRKAGDDGIHDFEPRSFLYRPGSRATSPQSELIDVAHSLRTALET